MTMLAAFMLGSMALAPDAEAAPDSGKEKAKALGSKGLNAAMIWAMLGMPGKGALAGLGAKMGLGGASAAGAGSGAGTGAAAVAGTGVAAAAAGTVGIVGAAFAAPMALFAYGFRKDNKLKHIRKMVNGPLTKKELGTGYHGFVEYLAEHPDKAKSLHGDGTISDEMYKHVQLLAIAAADTDSPLNSGTSWQRMWELDGEGVDPDGSGATATQQGANAVRASTAAQAASRYTAPTLKGAAGRGQITNVSPSGAATIKVPIEFEVGNALAIPAEYDRQKTQYQS